MYGLSFAGMCPKHFNNNNNNNNFLNKFYLFVNVHRYLLNLLFLLFRFFHYSRKLSYVCPLYIIYFEVNNIIFTRNFKNSSKHNKTDYFSKKVSFYDFH